MTPNGYWNGQHSQSCAHYLAKCDKFKKTNGYLVRSCDKKPNIKLDGKYYRVQSLKRQYNDSIYKGVIISVYCYGNKVFALIDPGSEISCISDRFALMKDIERWTQTTHLILADEKISKCESMATDVKISLADGRNITTQAVIVKMSQKFAAWTSAELTRLNRGSNASFHIDGSQAIMFKPYVAVDVMNFF
ncbi:hypothetical protein SARC_14450 [Sphaeroforma arctica JP610]|uniref:Uncharacterized protein n=1 Tax=Sphaeroforma arctica JP610 TaxID=667725 RepID=A0A0L0FA36_9EUKA|nr:hypothetical protein SARC_14450 [Sphaeroforma arctica JP610]KNC72988.1 hypothetical protein SARC_14450 [Sphaeroforma arctica JP610]|eukprot:XP_014146890.1 hypothetical protein SARC_14450 [Sphaeroforma arctica JP610]